MKERTRIGFFFYEKTSIRGTDGLLWKKERDVRRGKEKRLIEDQPQIVVIMPVYPCRWLLSRKNALCPQRKHVGLPFAKS